MNRTIIPPIIQTSDLPLDLKEPLITTLDNGIKVYQINAGTQDVLLLDFVWEAGNVYEQKNLVSGAVSHLLKCGTKSHNAYQLNEAFEYYGAYVNRGAGAEYANITLHTLSKHAVELLPLLYNIIYESTLPQEELDLFITQRVQQLSMNLQKSDFVANRFIDEYLYGYTHPYGIYSTKEAYQSITQEECTQFYKKHYQQTPFTLFIGGKIPDDLITHLNQLFGKQQFHSKSHERNYQYNPATEKQYRITNDEKSVQGAIRIARPFHNRQHPDFKACMVLNTLFGGFFGSRLMSNIREDKGYTYGIHSYVQNHITQTAWMISTEAGKDVCEKALTEVYFEMERLKNELVGEDELQLVKNYMMGQLLSDLEGPFQLVNRWKIYFSNNVDKTYFNEYVATIKNCTPQQIQTLAKKYFNKEDFYELIVY